MSNLQVVFFFFFTKVAKLLSSFQNVNKQLLNRFSWIFWWIDQLILHMNYHKFHKLIWVLTILCTTNSPLIWSNLKLYMRSFLNQVHIIQTYKGTTHTHTHTHRTSTNATNQLSYKNTNNLSQEKQKRMWFVRRKTLTLLGTSQCNKEEV